LILIALVILLFSSVYLFYYNVQDSCKGPWVDHQVRVTANAPKYFSAGDEDEVHITVVNERSATTGITVTMSYSGTLPCMTGDDASHAVGFASLTPRERATARFRVQFPLCLNQPAMQSWSNRPAQFNIWLTVDGQPPPQDPLATISLEATPIPKARTLGNLSGALLAGLLAWSWKELWEWLKKTERPIAVKGKAGK
jgi:hypothetical protein